MLKTIFIPSIFFIIALFNIYEKAYAEDLIKFDPPLFESVKLLDQNNNTDNAMELTPRVASLIAIKSRPNLFSKYNSNLYQIVNIENPKFKEATDTFSREELATEFIKNFQLEANKLDINQVYKLSIQANMDDMRPGKTCAELNRGSFSGFEVAQYPWQFGNFKIYDPFPKQFNLFCAESPEQAKEYSRIMSKNSGGIVNYNIYFKAIPGLYYSTGTDGLSVHMKIIKIEAFGFYTDEKLFEIKGK